MCASFNVDDDDGTRPACAALSLIARIASVCIAGAVLWRMFVDVFWTARAPVISAIYCIVSCRAFMFHSGSAGACAVSLKYLTKHEFECRTFRQEGDDTGPTGDAAGRGRGSLRCSQAPNNYQTIMQFRARTLGSGHCVCGAALFPADNYRTHVHTANLSTERVRAHNVCAHLSRRKERMHAHKFARPHFAWRLACEWLCYHDWHLQLNYDGLSVSGFYLIYNSFI